MAAGNLFWGALLILIGASLVFENVFSCIWPIMKIVIAIVLVYKGISLIFGCNDQRYSADS